MKGTKLLIRFALIPLLLLALFALTNPGRSVSRAYAACPATTYPSFGYDTGRTSNNPVECVISPLVAPPVNWASGFVLPTTSREGIATDPVRGYVASGNTLLAFQLATGAAAWVFGAGAPLVGAPTVYLGDIYFGTQNGTFFQVNPAGGLVCNVALGAAQPILSTPIGFGNSLIFSTGSGQVFAVNAATCAVLWVTPVLGIAPTSLSLINGTALVSVQTAAGGPSDVTAINAATGAVVGISPALPGVFTPPVVTTAGQIFVGSSSPNVGLAAFKFALPALPVAWVAPLAGEPVNGKPAVDLPGVPLQQVYAVSGTTGRLFAVNAATGAINWALPAACGPLYSAASPTVANGGVYVGGKNCMNAFKTGGGPTWGIALGPLVDTPATVVNGAIYFAVNLGGGERVFSI